MTCRSPRADVRLGDFREVLADLPDGSVRAIVTDPPYPRSELPLWTQLGEFAARVLDPELGVLVALSGQYYLPDVLRRLGRSLDFRWVVAQLQPGAMSRIHARRVIQAWKPWLVFQRPGARVDTVTAWLQDTVHSPGHEKELYEWQQSPAPAHALISQLVPAGALVVDPFAGVGTYGIAAVRAGARFIGAELDPDRHQTAATRIADAAEQPTLPGFRVAYDPDPPRQTKIGAAS